MKGVFASQRLSGFPIEEGETEKPKSLAET
jgi:hypothetical protein